MIVFYKMRNKKQPTKEIICTDGMVSYENGLPMPYVYCPGHYGTFIGFSKTETSEFFFCTCSKKAIENYLQYRLNFERREKADDERNFVLSKYLFPQKTITNLFFETKISERQNLIYSINFMSYICHECNKLTPKFLYCNSMYGGLFEQNYGWYINKQSLEYGVLPPSFKIIRDFYHSEIFDILEDQKQMFLKKIFELTETELILLSARDSDYQKARRKIRNIIENEVRVKFGFKKVGEAWANETLLYQLTCELHPNIRVIRHYRPEWLGFLELDVFIPSLNIGMEYQGIQHFKPLKHWGGKKSLNEVKKRDKRKKVLCEKYGVKLIYFYYYEDINKDLLLFKINSIN